MTLSPGSRLGPYEIVSAIGAGGMGEVYRARDPRLGRDVAIKILPPSFAADADRLRRFEQEARAVAALNHPNILTVHEIGAADGPYIVSELLDGRTLRATLANGGLSVKKLIDYGLQIANGLSAAHDKGIVHRDLKPENVFVTSDGRVKILDFGLAKLTEPAMASVGGPTLPTRVVETNPGLVMGTVGYMSPEQVRGLAVDQRSDIFSFGAILHEMVYGERAFKGDTAADTINAILHEEPPEPPHGPKGIPPALDRLIRHCLEKAQEDRFQSSRDLAFALAGAGAVDHGLATESQRPITAKGRRLSMVLAGAAVVVAGTAGAWWWWPVTTPTPARPAVMRLDVDLGVELSRSQTGPDVGISPNGERLVFMSNGRLFTRRLDQSTSTALEGTDGALNFFFSPDSSSVAFFAEDKLKRVSLDGGSVVTICDAPAGRGGTWGEDEVIVAALDKLEGLSRVPAAGGTPGPLTRLAPGEITHRWPQRLPGQNVLLFTSHTLPGWFDKARIEALSLADGRRKTLLENASFGRFIQAADGTDYVVFRRGASMFAVAFDADRLELRGAPFPVLEQVASSDSFGFASFDTSRTGTWVYRIQNHTTVNWLDNSGAIRPLLVEPGGYQWITLSHDGSRLAFVLDGDVWVHDIGRETRTRLAIDASLPLWTPDDRFIVFRHAEGLSWVRSDGGTPPQALTRTKHVQMPFSFSGDGQRLSFAELNASGRESWNLWTVPVRIDGPGLHASTPEPFLITPFDEREITFSADGRWVAYSSNDSGRREIYVRTFPDDGRKWQVSTSGGDYPQWPRDSQELFFQGPDGLIMMTPYSVHADRFVPEKPRVWSKQPIDNRSETRYFSVASDAGRVAAIVRYVPPGQSPDRSVTLLINALDRFVGQIRTSRARLPELPARESP